MRTRQNRRRHSRFATDLERDPMTTRWAAAERWRVYSFLGYYHLLFFAGQYVLLFPAREYTYYLKIMLLCVSHTRYPPAYPPPTVVVPMLRCRRRLHRSLRVYGSIIFLLPAARALLPAWAHTSVSTDLHKRSSGRNE